MSALRGAQRGPLNPQWNGGRSIASNGYVLIRVGTGHHLADVRGYAYEHRLVAEELLGRRLREDEQVHHINESKQDNRPENLTVVQDIAHHRVLHRRTTSSCLRLPHQVNPTLACRCGCKTLIQKYDAQGRPRAYVSGHNPQPNEATQDFLAALGDGALKLAEIARRTGRSAGATKVLASKLARRGVVRRVARGLYAAGAP